MAKISFSISFVAIFKTDFLFITDGVDIFDAFGGALLVEAVEMGLHCGDEMLLLQLCLDFPVYMQL